MKPEFLDVQAPETGNSPVTSRNTLCEVCDDKALFLLEGVGNHFAGAKWYNGGNTGRVSGEDVNAVSYRWAQA